MFMQGIDDIIVHLKIVESPLERGTEKHVPASAE